MIRKTPLNRFVFFKICPRCNKRYRPAGKTSQTCEKCSLKGKIRKGEKGKYRKNGT